MNEHISVTYSNTRIEDDTDQFTQSYIDYNEDITNMLGDIDNELAQQNSFIKQCHDSSSTEDEARSWRYPIEDHLFTDINHHARTCMYVNLYICPYQVRMSTDNTPFLQFIMQKKNAGGVKNLRDHANNYMDFYSKTYFDHHMININFLDEVDKVIKIMMIGYGKVLTNNDNDKIKYKGFIKRDNDFYVFVDISQLWLNHHYLNMHDHMWLVSIYELWGIKEVCSVPISDDVINLLNTNQYLTRLYHAHADGDGDGDKHGDKEYPMPLTGFTVEDKIKMDFSMMMGTTPSVHRDLPHAYVYYYDYNDCCYMLNNPTYDAANNEITHSDNTPHNNRDKVIMRNYIMYDKRVTYDDYIALSEEEKEGRVLIIDNVCGSRVGFVVCNHSCQTPVNSHDVLFM